MEAINWFIIIALMIIISGTVYTGMDVIKEKHQKIFSHKIIDADYVINECIHTNKVCFVGMREELG